MTSFNKLDDKNSKLRGNNIVKNMYKTMNLTSKNFVNFDK